MLSTDDIDQRLDEMKHNPDQSKQLWPENCDGSRKAMVVFVGPSPGGKKAEMRRSIQRDIHTPYWDCPYNDPLGWSIGFKKSFPPLVEAIFGEPYKYDDAAKLIARVNMDWLGNPQSKDVSYRYM